jgi:hypothetical protein
MHHFQEGKDYRSATLPTFMTEVWWPQERALNLNALPPEVASRFAETHGHAMRTLELPLDLMEELKTKNWPLDIEKVLSELGIVYGIILRWDESYNIDTLKKEGVAFIGSINDFGDINIESIDGHINSFKPWMLSKRSFNGRYSFPVFLFYTKKPTPVHLKDMKVSV